MNPNQPPQTYTNIQESPPSITPPPIPQTPSAPQAQQPSVSPGLIVLQWLTYAFWGWTLLGLSSLTFIVIYNVIDQADTSATLPYALAAVLVLLPISIVCDLFYTRRETQKKRGANMVVMVIHAVIFALFAIGSLIGAIFSLVQIVVATGESSSAIAMLVSLLIITILYGLTFLRTLNPFKAELKTGKYYSIVMLVITGIFLALSITGPFAQSLLTKDDRRIEEHLGEVKGAIDNYAISNKSLPSSLSDVTIDNQDGQKLVDDNLVKYTAVSSTKPTISNTNISDVTNTIDINDVDNSGDSYRYTLCVVYKKEKKDSSSLSRSLYDSQDSGYNSYVDTYRHPAGRVCYKLEYTTYN